MRRVILALLLAAIPARAQFTVPQHTGAPTSGGGGSPTLLPQNVCGGVANCATGEGGATSQTVTGLTLTNGWLVLCTVVTGTGNTAGCSDSNSNTWTSCKTFTGNHFTNQFYSIISAGGS